MRHKLRSWARIVLALVVAAFWCWCVGTGLDRAERARRDRIVRHDCQDRAWCWDDLAPK